jgi:hypothetical protein
MSHPSPEAVDVGRELAFEALTETLNLAASYARSASEAAFRGNPNTVGIHLRQTRLCVLDAIQIYKEMNGASQ